MHKPNFVSIIVSSYAYVYRLICGAKTVPNFTKPTYAEIREDTSKHGKIIENTGFFHTSINTCKKSQNDFRL